MYLWGIYNIKYIARVSQSTENEAFEFIEVVDEH